MSHTIGHTKKMGIQEQKDLCQYQDRITKHTREMKAIMEEMDHLTAEPKPFYWESVEWEYYGEYTTVGTYHSHISPSRVTRRRMYRDMMSL